jgi:serine/threonine protein kinase
MAHRQATKIKRNNKSVCSPRRKLVNALIIEIVAAIDAGRMGQVYRAKDTRLGRDVAIKALPETIVKDADRLAPI